MQWIFSTGSSKPTFCPALCLGRLTCVGCFHRLVLGSGLIWPTGDPELGFPSDSVVKHPPANAGDAGSVPGPGRSPEGETATHASILAWRVPWTEKPGRL